MKSKSHAKPPSKTATRKLGQLADELVAPGPGVARRTGSRLKSPADDSPASDDIATSDTLEITENTERMLPTTERTTTSVTIESPKTTGSGQLRARTEDIGNANTLLSDYPPPAHGPHSDTLLADTEQSALMDPAGNSKETQSETPVGPGTHLDHFVIVRSIGRGGNGEVFLARDTLLGRRVAIKLLHKEALGHKLAVEKFQFEARATAKFNHPHIVTVYFVGNFQGNPYVALEFLEGETLRKRMNNQSLSPKEIMRIGLAIAEALQEAHRHGILHRDLKPENVILPPDGRLRVLDFGLAKQLRPDLDPSNADANEASDQSDVGTSGEQRNATNSGLFGTPLYMSPEQWRSEPPTEAVDIWALGITMHELVSGTHPFEPAIPSTSLLAIATHVCKPEPVPAPQVPPDTPDALVEFIERCVDKSPEKRPSASDAADELRAMLHMGRWQTDGEVSPFRGLLPFTEDHADMFFGRDNEVARFVEQLRVDPVTPVIGPSGSGKSSFVRAGVVPRLLEQGTWLVMTMRPGRSPFATLARRLTRALTNGSELNDSSDASGAWTTLSGAGRQDALNQLADSLRAHPKRLALQLLAIAEHHKRRVLLVIDQFEELDTLVDDYREREAFAEAVATAADDPTMPVRVVFTLREDFLGRTASHGSLRNVLRALTLLQTPTRENLTEILTEPLRTIGYGWDDPNLVPEIVSQVEGDPSALAVMQFAASALWERRDKRQRLLLRSAYDAMGGIEGALAHQAQRLLGSLSGTQLATARLLLLRLVTPEKTRRVVPREELLDGLAPDAMVVLDRLIDERAVTVRRRASEADAELELVHESLIQNWKQLTEWLNESKEQRDFLAEIEKAAQLWDKRGRRHDEVWRGDALHDALRQAARINHLSSTCQAFLKAGEKRRSRQARGRRIGYAGAMAILGLVATTLAVQQHRADTARTRAERGERLAQRQSAASLRETASQAVFKGQRIDAVSRLRSSLELNDSLRTRAVLQRARHLPRLWVESTRQRVVGVDFSSETGDLIIAEFNDVLTTIQPWTRKRSRRIPDSKRSLFSFRLSPNGRVMAEVEAPGTLVLRSMESGEILWREPKTRCGASVAFTPDGKLIACPTTEQDVAVWQTSSGKLKQRLPGLTAPSYAIDISSDGRWMASTSLDGTLPIWDLRTMTLARTIRENSGHMLRVRFQPGSDLLVTTGDHKIRAWHAASGQSAGEVARHTDRVMGIEFSPDGRWLAWGVANRVLLKRWASKEPPVQLTEHLGEMTDLAFSSDSKLLASASEDGTTQVFDVTQIGTRVSEQGHRAMVIGAAFSLDGARLHTAGLDETWRIWDANVGLQVGEAVPVGMKVTSLALSPRGDLLAVAGFSGVIKLFDPRTRRQVRVLSGHQGSVWALAFSHDGTRLASGGRDTVINVWDPKTGTRSQQLRGHSRCVYGLSFDGADNLVSSAADGDVRRWNHAGQGKLVHHGHSMRGITCSQTRPWCAAAVYAGSVKVFDQASKGYVLLGDTPFSLRWPSLSPDESTLGVPGQDGQVLLWNVQSGLRTPLVGHEAGTDVNHVAFNPSGSRIATVGDDQTVRVWNARTGAPFWRTVALVSTPNAALTHRGWETANVRGKRSRTPAGGSTARAQEAWVKRLEQRDVARGSLSRDSSKLCIVTKSGQVQLWDTTASGHALAQMPPPPVQKPAEVRWSRTQLLSTNEGCAALGPDGVARWLTSAGKVHILSKHATAIASAPKVPKSSSPLIVPNSTSVLVSTADGVTSYAPDGSKRSHVTAGQNATALALTLEGTLVVGHASGEISIVSTVSASASPATAPAPTLPDSPRGAITSLLPCSKGLLAVGARDGTLGLWDLKHRTRLHVRHLHGPVFELTVGNQQVLAASELGDISAIDLSVFEADRCTVLRDVWKHIPTIWDNERAVPVSAPPPADHVCRP